MLETFTLDTFTQRLNSKFTIKPEHANPFEAELIRAQDVGTSPRQIQFSIVFRGPLDTFLPQAMYEFEHEELGSFALFIVPISQDEEGFYYEAIFNRPIK
ncbi:MAG TPA: hypothetical protein VF553_19405 [Pyrinomonadaceae bacterium]|jgi:hypothetical protein